MGAIRLLLSTHNCEILKIVTKQFCMLRSVFYYQIATFEMQEKCRKMRDGKIVNTALGGRVEPLKDIF